MCFALVGCGGKDKQDEKYKVYLLDCPTTGDWGIWYWLIAKDGSQNAVSSSNGDWPVGATSLDKSDKISKYVTFEIDDIDDYETLGCLFVNRDNGKQQTFVIVCISNLYRTKQTAKTIVAQNKLNIYYRCLFPLSKGKLQQIAK